MKGVITKGLRALLLSLLFVLSTATNKKAANCFEDFEGGENSGDGEFYGTVSVKIEGLCGTMNSVKGRVEDGVYEYLKKRLDCENLGSLSSIVMTSWKEAKVCGKVTGGNERELGGKKTSKGKQAVAKLQYVGESDPANRRMSSLKADHQGNDDPESGSDPLRKLRNKGDKPKDKGLKKECEETSGCASAVSLMDELKKQDGFDLITRATMTKVDEANCSEDSKSCSDGSGVCCGANGCKCRDPSKSLCEAHGCCITEAEPFDPGFCFQIGSCTRRPCTDTVDIDVLYQDFEFTADFGCATKENEPEKLKDLNLAISEFRRANDIDFVSVSLTFDFPDCNTTSLGDEGSPEATFTGQGARARKLRQLQKKKSKGKGKSGKKKCKGCDRRRLISGNHEVMGRHLEHCDNDDFLCYLNQYGFEVTEATFEESVEISDTVSISIPNDLVNLVCSDDKALCETPGTPQFKAISWLLSDPQYDDLDDTPKKQRYALAVFFWSTNGLQLARNWMDYLTSECLWKGIDCNDEKEIVRVQLPGELCGEGTLPKELALLENLEELFLHANNLEGTIPSSLGDIKTLKTLVLSFNQFDSTIPTEFGDLTNLEQLYLGSSGIYGFIPSEMGNMEKLEILWMEFNSLVGFLPTQIGGLSSLKTLALFENNLSGSVPSQIGDMKSLQFLYLYKNWFSSTIPSDIGELEELEHLYLWQNNLTGPIPNQIGQLKALTVLDMGINQLTGPIPGTIGELKNLEKMYLNRNTLTGNIPPQIGDMASLWMLTIARNDLTGSIPSQFGQLSNLLYLYLWGNNLNSTIPSEFGDIPDLNVLDVGINQLTGTIPTEIGKLWNLAQLYINYNKLTGQIPAEIAYLRNLEVFWFHGNDFIGVLPDDVCSQGKSPDIYFQGDCDVCNGCCDWCYY